jgi:hypothetical protein
MAMSRALEARYAATTLLIRQQLLPEPGEVLVAVGDRVQANDVVARTQRDGPIYGIDLVDALDVSLQDVERYLVVAPGDRVAAGDLLAVCGWPHVRRRRLVAPSDGTVQDVIDGTLFIRQAPEPFELRACVPGEIVETHPHSGVTIRSVGALVRGIWGSGQRRQGALVTLVSDPGQPLTWEMVSLRYRGTILVGGVIEDARVLYRASRFRLGGIIAGGLSARLRPLCETLPLPVVITEGMGHVPMARPIYEMLLSHHGHQAIITGAEQDGPHGPEVIIPLSSQAAPQAMALVVAQPVGRGQWVRLTRAPYLGMMGKIIALPSTPQETAIGTRAMGAQVRLLDGRQVFVPYVNLERLD